jgi:NDP-sugar pyrophosphorylase family protein
MLLAAGRGTRLGALGAARPKPMVPICGYPAIAFGLALCGRAGLRDVLINLHHHGEQIRAFVGDGAGFGVSVRYSVEEELLGTGGGLALARALLRRGEPVLVMNAKVVAEIDLAAVVAAHRAAPEGTLATMVVRADPDVAQFAPVSVDGSGRVIGLRGKRGPTTTIGPVSDRMFTGIHVLEPALLDRLPAAGVSDVIAEAYQPALEDGGRVQAMLMTGYFAEHSTPERYLAGNLALLRRPQLVSHPPGALVGIAPGAQVDPGATVRPPVRIAAGAVVEAGAVVGPDVVVGAGGRVAAGARLARAVVWEGAVARGAIEDAIVTAEDVVAAK